MPQPISTNFVSDSINSALANLRTLGDTQLSVKEKISLAGVQAELAKAAAMQEIAQAIALTAHRGQGIRYGLEPLVEAVKGMNEPQYGDAGR
jgi:hypothetical protein